MESLARWEMNVGKGQENKSRSMDRGGPSVDKNKAMKNEMPCHVAQS